MASHLSLQYYRTEFLQRIPSQYLAAILLIIACMLVGPYLLRSNIVDAKGHPIPPGPLFRYAFLRKYPERALHKWSKKYGPLFSVFMV